MMRRLPIRTGIAALLAAAVALLADDFQLRFAAEILVIGTAVMALDLLVGFGGMVSLGQAAVFGTAAYAAAIAAGQAGGALLLVLPAGIAAGTAVAATMGAAVRRTGSLFLLVLTLLLGQVVWEAAFHWRSVTGGADGLRGLTPLSLGTAGLGTVGLGGGRALFLLAAVLALASFGIARSFVAAPIGRALAATREQPLRMDALGYDVTRIRLLAMLLSGAITGAAGALYPFVNLYVGPQSVHWTLSAAMVIMLVIGGVGSLWGAFLGATVFLAAQTFLGSLTDRWQLFVGLIFVLTVLLLPAGAAGGLRRLAGRATGGEKL